MKLSEKYKTMKTHTLNYILSRCIFVICLFLPNINIVHGKDFTVLNNTEYKKDIEILFQILEEINPHIELRKELYGFDIDKIKKKYLPIADTLTTYKSFYALASRILNSFHDAHVSAISAHDPCYLNLDKNFKQDYNEFLKSLRFNNNRFARFYSDFKIINGKYKIIYPQCIVTDDWRLKTLIPFGSELVSVNNIPVSEYMQSSDCQSNNIMYDVKTKNIYTKSITPYTDLLIQTPQKDTIQINLTTSIMYFKGNVSMDNDIPMVHYFDTEKTVYIRIPEMDINYLNIYKKELSKLKKKDIERVVIDVRENKGGNDQTWIKLLSYIIADTLTMPQVLAFKNNKITKDFIKNHEQQWDNLKWSKLRDTTFAFLPNMSLKLLYDTIYIVPDKNSLDYKGKIVVLCDDQCFSSTLAFLSYTNKHPNRFISIGQTAGYFGGSAVTPFEFMLPNTKFLFRTPACFEVTNAQNLQDLLYSDIQIPIDLSLDDYFSYILFLNEGVYSKKYLHGFDRVFQKALEVSVR